MLLTSTLLDGHRNNIPFRDQIVSIIDSLDHDPAVSESSISFMIGIAHRGSGNETTMLSEDRT